jgi:exopolysaccharide biosynthesis polyprenyl glycosylphosphotransferase
MVVGSEEACQIAIHNFKNSKNQRHVITKAVLDNFYNNIKLHMDSVDIVYLADHIEEDEKIKIYELLIRNQKKLFLNTSFENLVLVNPNIMSIEDESIIEASNFQIKPEDDMIKRLVDFIASLVLLILASPIMLITAILVKLTSKGPVFYKQVRITKGQKEFNILKFRTMAATAEKDSGPVLATANDVRVTAIGKYLRSLRIDELPQLLNVLRGDMALVGPRPERPFFVDQFKEQNPYYYLRHNVRAGITGYAQVYGKYATDFNSKLNFDLVYIKKYSFVLDVKILLQTIKTLFDKVSSQGVDEVEIMPIPENIELLK